MADTINLAGVKASELVEPKVDKVSASIDLATVKKGETVYPAPAGGPLTPIQGAGVGLAKWLLTIMSAFLVLALVWFWATQWGFSARLSVPQPNSLTKEVVEAIAKDEETFQKFWTQTLQTVLQNVLLPVLTAILGYTFGSSQKEKEGR